MTRHKCGTMSIFTNVIPVLSLYLMHLYVTGAQLPNEVEVRTNNGPVTGYREQIAYKSIYIFKNIRYARPPEGHLRFQPPQDMQKWSTTVAGNMQRTGPSPCPQYTRYSESVRRSTNNGTEDCLLLDVYSAKNPNDNVKRLPLPVVVYFHGGRFVQGHKDEYKPINLMRADDIIVVIPNFRLGVLGFLSTEDEILPGNLGLLDQRMALKWVSENIASFGGDSSRVTIAGHGSGGASVGLHVVSKLSSYYFSAAISASGTALDAWVMQHFPRNTAALIAARCSCPTHNNKKMIDCLRYKPLSEIIEAQDFHRNLTLGPVFDGNSTNSMQTAFLSDLPQQLYRKRDYAKVPYLAGVTRDEASVEYFNKFTEATAEGHLDKMLNYYMCPYLKHHLNMGSIVKAAKYNYLKGISVPSFLAISPNVTNLLSDFLYKSSLVQTLKLHSVQVPDTWMYVYEFQGDVSLGDALGPQQYRTMFGISHMEDVMYLFDVSYAPINSTSPTYPRYIPDRLSEMWRNFIITRQPPISSYRWLKFNDTNLSYMEISNAMRPLTNYKQSDMDFWNLLVPDLIAVTPTNATQYVAKYNSATTWGLATVVIILTVMCVALAAVVVVTRKKIMRNCSLPVCSTKDSTKM